MNKFQQQEIQGERCVKTAYLDHRKNEIKIGTGNHKAVHPNAAVQRAFTNMRLNKYAAWVAVIYDESTAEVYATITRNVKGEVKCKEHGDPNDYFDPNRPKTWLALMK